MNNDTNDFNNYLDDDINKDILDGSVTAYIDDKYHVSNDIKPKLVVNDSNNNVLDYLKNELHTLNEDDEFYFCVSFIRKSGITPLLPELEELEQRNVKGKILTTDYFFVTEPQALEKLNKFRNIEVKFFYQQGGFHTKGYIFKHDGIYSGLVGSSNLTQNALKSNEEWNVSFSSLYDGEILQNVLKQFNILWSKAHDVDSILDEYKITYNNKKNYYLPIITNNNPDRLLKPNSMQKEFIFKLRDLIDKGEKRALLVSATGTGKTYASAFAVKDAKPEKFLFVVHLKTIVKQAMESYKRVFKGEEKKFGYLTGEQKDWDKEYLFATRDTLSQEKIYTRFRKDEFDYIVVDEVHNAGSSGYQKIFNYFTPKFYLGMTASPERTDNFNIYELFDYNVPLKIRLEDALEKDLICPFHYFGISTLEIGGIEYEDKSNSRNINIKDLVTHILEKSEYYGYSGDRIKALVFCNKIQEAKDLAEEFENQGHKSIALSGEDNTKDNNKIADSIDRLTNDDREDKLEYIMTVGIFNEGVDIPEVNQVILLRPTKSSIIFIQQLGRGLRKSPGKHYVVILDFIANYDRNYLIPIALSGDASYDKDISRKFLMEPNKQIRGASTINFDEISKKRIYQSINQANFSQISIFKEKYKNLKYELGRTPYLVDFYESKELDPPLMFKHKEINCYYDFLKKCDDEYDETLTPNEIKSLIFITENFSDGKRPHELIILKLLLQNKYFTVKQVEEELKKYDITNDHKSVQHSFRIFNHTFNEDNKEKYHDTVYFICDDNINDIQEHSTKKYSMSKQLEKYLESPIYLKHFNDLINYALERYLDKYNPPTEKVNLRLYAKYSRKDVLRLLNYPKYYPLRSGYQINKQKTCMPMFVTYHKKDDIAESAKYKDEFESREIISWMSTIRRRIDGDETKQIRYNKQLKKHLFIIKRKIKKETEYYYMGQVDYVSAKEVTMKDNNGIDQPVVNYKFKLHNKVPEELYNYLVNDIE